MATAGFLYLCVGFPFYLCSCLELTDFEDFNSIVCLNELFFFSKWYAIENLAYKMKKRVLYYIQT